MIIPSDIAHLEKVMQWARENISKAGFSLAEKRHIELALEEAVVNIIRHAKVKEFEVECEHSRDAIIFILKDQGAFFNPLTKIVKQSSEEEGGWGLSLMKKCIDEITYERKEPYNILHLKKLKK